MLKTLVLVITIITEITYIWAFKVRSGTEQEILFESTYGIFFRKAKEESEINVIYRTTVVGTTSRCIPSSTHKKVRGSREQDDEIREWGSIHTQN